MTTEQLPATKVVGLGAQSGDPHLALLKETRKAPTGAADTPIGRSVLRRADFTIGPVARLKKRLRRARTMGLLGLFVVYVTISLALVAVAPAMGLGWTSVVITSGSMSPVLRTGDVVVASPHDGVGLGPGAVVVFTDPARPGLLTHRIEAVNPDGSYVTSGDANRQPDSTPLLPEQVVAVGRIRVPFVGMPLVWYWAQAWGQLAVWAAATLGAVWLARYAFLDEHDLGAASEESPVAEDGNDRIGVPFPEITAVTTTLPVGDGPNEEMAELRPVTAVGVSTRELSEMPSRINAVREAPLSGPGPGQRRPLSRPRQISVADVSRSSAEIPHVTTFDDVDVSRLLGVQQALGRRHETEIPLEALVVMAVIPALQNFPEFNATLDGEELRFHRTYDVGVTVGTLDGSMVAVVRDAAAKGLMELASEVRRLGEGATGGSLPSGVLTGQTFTLANWSAVGGGHSTPTVSPGTTAILSVGRAQRKPIVVDDELVIAPVMPLSLSYDDRVIDDGLGRRFLSQVIENLEEPALFLVT